MHQMLRSLSLAQGSRQVGDHEIRHGLGRTARHFATVALTPTAWSFGAITAWAPAPSATAQAGAEVVRIGHAVQDQQQGRVA
jgi:hypothetical protein